MARSQSDPRRRGHVQRLFLPIRVAGKVLTLLLPVALVGGLAFLRSVGIDALAARDQRPALTVGASQAAIDDLRTSAADTLAAALAKDGSGISFSIVQRSMVRPKAGGRQLVAPDPVDPAKFVVVDESPFGSLTERGTATADRFYAELREGPAPGQDPDWTTAPSFQALARDGVIYRNDGEGWYKTDDPPGIGLDPKSMSLLPGVLRNATALSDAGVDPADGSLRDLTGAGRLVDIPGLIAADGKAFTDLTDRITYRLDPDGKLVALRIVARNTNLEAYNLVVETEIRLVYKAVDLPEPRPLLKDASPVVVP